MAGCAKILFALSVSFLVLKSRIMVAGEPQFPCYFIFGDSLVDNGNNNDLQTMAKVNYPPYGIDFPDGPTGRFSNGRNLVDFIAKDLGFDNPIPPFSTAKGQDILRGVNYGSGGAGILDETGKQVGDRISLGRQLINHQTTISRIKSMQGNKTSTEEYLSKCLYTVGMGSNDYINNYFASQFFNSSRLFTPDQFAAVLMDQYSQQLNTLFKLGARKIAVFGLGPIGCTPAQVAMFGTNGGLCVRKINIAVKFFNRRLKSLVDDLNNYLTNAKFISVFEAGFPSTIPSTYGIKMATAPCCTISTAVGGRGQCVPNKSPCNIRALRIFFDGFHPTESANRLLGTIAYISLSRLI